MQDIKFRVFWEKQIRYNAICGNGQVLFNPNAVGEYKWINQAECISMQFTGLQDRNQRDIYESDICQYSTADGSVLGIIIYERQACAFWLKWHDGAAHRYKELKANFSDGEIWYNNCIEIVGNVHENTELLPAIRH